MIRTSPVILLFFPLCSLATERKNEPPFEHSHEREAIKVHFHVSLEEKYFSEGRDNLDGGDLLVNSLGIGYRHVYSRIWYAESSEKTYKELRFSAGMQEVIDNTELYIEYTRYPYPDDNEIAAGARWPDLIAKDVSLSVGGYHSFNAQGTFWEIALDNERRMSDKLSLTIMATLGINQGYVSDGHSGVNHLALTAESAYAMAKSLSIVTRAGYSQALNKQAGLPGDDNLVDTFHGSVNLQWSF